MQATGTVLLTIGCDANNRAKTFQCIPYKISHTQRQHSNKRISVISTTAAIAFTKNMMMTLSNLRNLFTSHGTRCHYQQRKAFATSEIQISSRNSRPADSATLPRLNYHEVRAAQREWEESAGLISFLQLKVPTTLNKAYIV